MQIEEARVIIAKMHPMINTPYHKVLPSFGWLFKCCFCCGGSRQEHLDKFKQAIIKEREEHKEKIQNVFDEFGVDWVGVGVEEADQTGNGKKIEEVDEEEYDPYNMLGYGFMAYFKTLRTFAVVFLLISVIMLPAFAFYAQAGGLKKVSHGYYNSVFMMGNLGFNKAVCESTYVALNANSATMECEIG